MYGCGWSNEKAEEEEENGNCGAGSKSASAVAQPTTKPTEKLLLRCILQPRGRPDMKNSMFDLFSRLDFVCPGSVPMSFLFSVVNPWFLFDIGFLLSFICHFL